MKPQVDHTSSRETMFHACRAFRRQLCLPAILTIGLVCSLLLTGCGPTGSAVSQSTGGHITNQDGHITNQDGHVTGVIAAIDVKLEVRDVETSAVANKHTAGSKAGANAQSTYNRWEITAGEVKIEMERVDDGPISLAIDGEDYGTINEGDALLIDEQRQVLVNGTRRESRGATND